MLKHANHIKKDLAGGGGSLINRRIFVGGEGVKAIFGGAFFQRNLHLDLRGPLIIARAF